MRVLLFSFMLFLTQTVMALELKIGTVFFSPPFEMVTDKKKEMTGFDIDLMRELCQRINAQCLFSPRLFEDLFTQINEGTLDLAISSISITLERQSAYLFSLPYLASDAQFLTLSSTPWKKISELRGKRLGVESGTLFKTMALDLFGPNLEVSTYKDTESLLLALSNDEIDAVILDYASSQYWVANNSQYQLLGEKISIGLGYGIMAARSKQDLINELNTALLAMEADGGYIKLYNRYISSMSP